MKKVFFIVSLTFAFIANAQNVEFGAKLGYTSMSVSASFQGVTSSDSVNGFYASIFSDISLDDKLIFEPEFRYVRVSQDGGTGNLLLVPLMLKYEVAEKFNLQGGPQLDYILDESQGITKFGFGLGLGLGFDISDDFFLEARYSFGLNNRLENVEQILASQGVSGDISVNINFLQIGLGYKFK